MRLLNINELLEVGHEVLPENEFNGYKQTAEQLAHHLAIRLTDNHKHIRYASPAVFEGGFGGLCVGFKINCDCVHSPTTAAIRSKDEGGEDQ
jgi:hypothetical protein